MEAEPLNAGLLADPAEGIDAPEPKQAFGTRSRQHLSDLIFGKQVTVLWNTTNRYHRVPGKIMEEGKDIHLEQIRFGMACYYRTYEREVAREDRKPYADADEADTKAAKRGLRADSKTLLPPWDFRPD